MQILKKFLRNHPVTIRVGIMALTAVCAVTALSQTALAKTTYVITDGNQVMVHTTYATDPADVLDEADLSLSDADTYETQPGQGVTEINVLRGMNVTIDYRGEKLEAVSYGETVQELLDRLELEVAEGVDVSVPTWQMVHDGMEIRIFTSVFSTDSYTAEIPFETVYQKTDLLASGTEVVLVRGVPGQMICTADVTYVNGIETNRVVLTQEQISAPVNKVVAVGTGDGKKTGKPIIGDGVIITGQGDVVTYTKHDTFKATAYCRTDVGGQWTATGTPTRVGAIAVDPKVIPYGTRMFIVTKDGKYIYGVATAEDCGGSIKGKRLDLFYETDAECRRFGIRDCDVYFLG